MILKYYAEVTNIKEAVPYYKELFDADVIKSGINGYHASLNFFGKIKILLNNERRHREKPGYYIIKFEDHEIDLFKKHVKRIKKRKDINLEFDLTTGSWQITTFFQFKDKYGHSWVLEANTAAL